MLNQTKLKGVGSMAPVIATYTPTQSHSTPMSTGGVNATSITVTEQIYDYLRYCEYKKKNTPDTLKTKYYHISQFVRENDVTDLCQITNRQLDDWCDMKVQNGMKEKTANGHIDDIVGCIKFLKVKRDMKVALDFDKVERYRLDRDETAEDLPGFTAEEILFIKQHCKTLLEELVFSMTFESAMRVHEITHLRVEDMQKNKNGRVYFRITGKGGKRRNTFVLPQTMRLLERWLILAGISEGYIFPSPINEGRPYTREQMRKIICRPIRRAGYMEGGPHALRRSAITEALENGMPVHKVAKWVGHADTRVTLRHYYRQDNERMQEEHHAALQAALAQSIDNISTLAYNANSTFKNKTLFLGGTP